MPEMLVEKAQRMVKECMLRKVIERKIKFYAFQTNLEKLTNTQLYTAAM